MILKWDRYYTFYTNLQAKKHFQVNLVVSEALITNVTNRGKARAILAIDPFRKRHKLVHNGRFQNFKVLLVKIL